jgi:hypothetical protein
MTYVTLLTITLLVMNVLMTIQAVLVKRENKQNAKLRKLVIDLCHNCMTFISRENGVFKIISKDMEGFLVQMIDNLKDTRKENSDFIEKVQSEYAETLIRYEGEKERAVRELNVLISAIKSLEPNYKKKVQHQIDRIIERKKPQPIRKES